MIFKDILGARFCFKEISIFSLRLTGLEIWISAVWILFTTYRLMDN